MFVACIYKMAASNPLFQLVISSGYISPNIIVWDMIFMYIRFNRKTRRWSLFRRVTLLLLILSDLLLYKYTVYLRLIWYLTGQLRPNIQTFVFKLTGAQVGWIDRPDQGFKKLASNQCSAKFLKTLWAFEDRNIETSNLEKCSHVLCKWGILTLRF